MSKSVIRLISIHFWNWYKFLTRKKAPSKLKILFWLFRSLNFWDPNVPRWQGHFRGFRAWKYFDSRFFAWTNVLKLSLWPRTYNMSFLHIPGVTFASKVEICKLVMFCPKYLIWCQVLFLNLMQRPEKLFHNVILVIFSLKNVNRTPYLEGNTQLFHPLCKTH